MSKAKTENYTTEMVQEMSAAYTAADTQEARDAVVSEMAEKFGKSRRSIISKMSREGFYQKKETVSKVTGEKPAKKEDLAVSLREVSGLPLVSAEKLNKTDLLDLIAAFKGNE